METLAPQIIFWVFAVLMLGSAVIVVHGKNLVRSAFALLATFFSVAVFYVMLGADFLAGAQVLIYVGGILTLILFGVMLTNRIYNLNLETATFQVVPGAMVSLAVFVLLTTVITRTPWSQASDHRGRADDGEDRSLVDDGVRVAVRGRLGAASGGTPRRRHARQAEDGPVIPLEHYLIVAAALFSLGLYGMLTRKNAINVLMAIELIFNSANLNLVAFSRFVTGDTEGQVFALFVIVIAACEAAVALAIVMSLYRIIKDVSLDEASVLKG